MTTVWRPRGHIRVIALGLHWRAGRLLAAEVRDDAGRLKGVRPLGGGVDFGETAAAALQREFMEELGVEIAIAGAPVVMENIYRHEGAAAPVLVLLPVTRICPIMFGSLRTGSAASSTTRYWLLWP